jgi:hypothetical protein
VKTGRSDGAMVVWTAAFFDITQGNNDLAGVGCCQATVGYDLASGLGVPDWAVLPATLPPPG